MIALYEELYELNETANSLLVEVLKERREMLRKQLVHQRNVGEIPRLQGMAEEIDFILEALE